MNMIDYARKYVFEHKWSVIPVRPGDKRPLIEWKEYQNRLPTNEELDKWFRGTGNNIGIVTGKVSNLTVLDKDDITKLTHIKSKVAVRTPRGGEHLYFLHSEEANTNAGTIDTKIDVRSEGGFVVAPSSAGYRWFNPWFISSQLESFPASLLTRLEVSQRDGKAKLPLDVAGLLASITEGNRNDSFTRIVGKLHRARFAPSDILLLLAPYAGQVNFATDELESIIASVSRYVDAPAENTESESVEAFLENITETDWFVDGLIAKGSIQFVAGLPETYKTWLLLDLAIEAAKGGGLWLGKFKTKPAKTLFIDQERFRGETQRRIKSLLTAKGIKPSSLRGNLYLRCGSTTRIDMEESYKAFHTELQRIRPELILIDSFATFHSREENNRQDIQVVLERIKQLRQEFGCTIIFIDHEGKGVFQDHENKEAPNAFRMVGSVGKVAAAEVVFTVRKYDPLTCMVYVTKNTLAPCLESFPLTVTDVPNGVIVSSPTES